MKEIDKKLLSKATKLAKQIRIRYEEHCRRFDDIRMRGGFPSEYGEMEQDEFFGREFVRRKMIEP